MAKLATVVRTYFEGGTYRNNTIIVEIPDEAADIIKKSWDERGAYNCVTAKFLASNQAGICLLHKDGGENIGVIQGMSQEDTRYEEVFKRHFKDEEEDDE